MIRAEKWTYSTTPRPRRANFLIVMTITTLLSLSATAQSDTPGQQHMASGLSKFEERAGFEIYRAFARGREEFRLGLSKKTSFAFYGAKKNELTAVDCKQSAHFSMISYANDRGPFNVGDCREHKEEIRMLLKSAEAGLKAALANLQSSGPVITDEKLREAGWVYERKTSGNGSELHYFPVLLHGHGMLVMPTVVLLTDESALVIQVDVTSLCSPGNLEDHPLCKNTRQSLEDLALRLRTKLMQTEGHVP